MSQVVAQETHVRGSYCQWPLLGLLHLTVCMDKTKTWCNFPVHRWLFYLQFFTCWCQYSSSIVTSTISSFSKTLFWNLQFEILKYSHFRTHGEQIQLQLALPLTCSFSSIFSIPPSFYFLLHLMKLKVILLYRLERNINPKKCDFKNRLLFGALQSARCQESVQWTALLHSLNPT